MSHILTCRPTAERGALNLNECCVVPVEASTGPAWMLFFYVRADDGREQTFRVPVNPNGQHTEHGPLGRTWGLNPCGVGEWQVSPSIDFGNWHRTPKIVGVPDGEEWSRK